MPEEPEAIAHETVWPEIAYPAASFKVTVMVEAEWPSAATDVELAATVD